jgi:chromate transporter
MQPLKPTFREALRYWIWLGFISFGGPAGQIGIMHKDLVERKRWISEDRFMHALNYCMVLPGPEAQQLAIYIGWLLHRVPGGIAAGVFFIVPGFATILGLSLLYVLYGDVAWVTGMFDGLRPAVVAIIASALIRIGGKALHNTPLVLIALAAFTGIFALNIPFPIIIIAAALGGFAGGKYMPRYFTPPRHGGVANGGHSTDDDDGADDMTVNNRKPTGIRGTIRTVAFWGVAWLAPVAVLLLLFGWDNVYSRLSVFFSTAAVVTFGGAYAVLAYMAQAAVEWYGWMEPGQMLDGLAMAESTPGPLIQVTQFVGFLAAFNVETGMHPITAGILAAVLVTWVTFMPSFLWIFAGAPYIENLRGNKTVGPALSAITAAVVGVILNLAIWLGINTVVGWFPAAVALLSFTLIQFLRVNVIAVILISVILGIGYQYL